MFAQEGAIYNDDGGYEDAGSSYDSYGETGLETTPSVGGSMMGEIMAGVGAAVGLVVIGMIYFLVVVFLIVYALGHVKRKKGENHDPFLGPKVMLTLFMSICFQAILFGLAALLVIASLDTKGAPKAVTDGMTDVPLGLMLGGILAGVYPTVLFLAGIRGRGSVNIGRKALGVNAIIAGIFSTLGIIGMLVMSLMDVNIVKVLLFTVVYLVAFIGCSVPLVVSASREYASQSQVDNDDVTLMM